MWSVVIFVAWLFGWRGLLNYENAVAIVREQAADFPGKVHSQAEWDALGSEGQLAYLRQNVRPNFELELRPGEQSGWIDRRAGVFFYDVPPNSIRSEVVYDGGTQEVIEQGDTEWFRHGIKRVRVSNMTDKTIWMKVWNMTPW